MGNYNAHSPIILGNEWVPIRESDYAIDVETERGYAFHLDHSAPVVSGSFFIREGSPNVSQRTVLMHVYSAGDERSSGPVQKLIIPVSVVTTSTVDGSFTLFGATTYPEAVRDPGDNSYFSMSNESVAYFNFDVDAYTSQLDDKRIIDVNVRYVITGPTPSLEDEIYLWITRGATLTDGFIFVPPNIQAETPFIVPQVEKLPLGNTCLMVNALDIYDTPHKFPWRYDDLARFENGASNEMAFAIRSNGNFGGTPTFYVSYVALEVTYCEETRVAFGGISGTYFASGILGKGQNLVPLRNVSTFATSTTLTPGDYVVTLSLGSISSELEYGATPRVSALTELFPGSGQRALEITRSTRENRVFQVSDSTSFTPLALHTASAVVTGVHAYHDQFGAPVYNANSATQEIDASRAPISATEYPQVRFYARRFGETNVNLTLTGVDDANTPVVSISPTDFDALPEIIDGWREVTLRFTDDIPTFSSADGAPDWVWSATGLDAADQWQILAMDAQGATSGARQVDRATYGAPNGATVELSYNSAADTSTDAVLIFSQDPPLVTGFAVSETTQSLDAVDPECNIAPECVPTALGYNQLTWDPFAIYDNFTETVVDDWGSTATGEDWSHFGAGGTASSDFQKTGTVGTMSVSQANAYRVSYLAGVSLLDVEVFAEGSISETLIAGDSIEPIAALTRITSTTSYFMARVAATSSETLTVTLYNPAGSTIATADVPNMPHNSDQRIKLRMQSFGTMHRARVWNSEMTEPTIWHVTANDTSGMTAGGVGVRIGVASGNIDPKPIVGTYYQFVATPMSLVDGYLEIQRQDDTEADDEWNTIAHVSAWTTTTFNDYEARVGVASRYRARVLNVLDFAGSWSSEVEHTLTSPGVSGIGTTGNSVLIFTTNERQDGSSNLAYVQTWESNVTEDFTFPEASAIQLQELYRRDYVVAFRPTERGGERFSRSILVNNAAVSSGRIRDGFRSLRDMAWDDVSYICVRNELGDRWLANVQVPSGKIQRNRRLYIAQINVIETTDTPSVVAVTEE